MSSLKRKIENIKIDNKDYVLAFDMNSIEMFQDMTGKSILKSLNELNSFEDKTVLSFIACTLRHKEDAENPIGKDLYSGDYDLLALMVMLLPTISIVLNAGFPKASENKVKKNKVKK